MRGCFIFSVDSFPCEVEVDGACIDSSVFSDPTAMLERAKELAKEEARKKFERVLTQIDEHSFEDVYDDCEPEYNY